MQPLHSYISVFKLRRLIEFALDEDLGDGDLTTCGALSEKRRQATVHAKLVAKVEGVLAGNEIFRLVFTSLAEEVSCDFSARDGARFAAGEIVAQITGPAGIILQAERTALNFIGKLSGIATVTERYVSAVSDATVSQTKCKILDTRKTTPGWRALEKYAVNCGGGFNHRFGLFDMALIKENHIRAAGSISQAVGAMRKYLTETGKSDILIEVEVQNRAELEEALQAGVDRLLLDNRTPAQLREMVSAAREHSPETQLEASGNVTLATVAKYAETGVDFISIGALTHSAPTADLSLLIT